MKAATEIVVTKPIQDVWAFVSNIENMDRWVKGVTEPKWTSEGELGVGSTFASKYTYRNRTFDIAYSVTAFSPPSHFAVKATSGPFPFDGILDLEPAEDGTRVTNTIDAGSDSTITSVIFVVLGPLVRMMMRRQLGKELEVLKAILETQSQA